MKHDGMPSIKKEKKKDVLTFRTTDVKDNETNLTQAYLKQRNKISVETSKF
jgi:hypothetical protein